MRQDSLEMVKEILDTGKYVTIKQIREKTGLSVNTIYTALATLNARSHRDAYPVLWTAAVDIDTTESIAQTKNVVLVDLDCTNIIQRWSKGRLKFGNDVMTLTVDPEDDPEELANHFAIGASILASMAVKLRSVQDKPDWYELLNGENAE